jgi:hypothetical protein
MSRHFESAFAPGARDEIAAPSVDTRWRVLLFAR